MTFYGDHDELSARITWLGADMVKVYERVGMKMLCGAFLFFYGVKAR
jgi:hypothetical protein